MKRFKKIWILLGVLVVVSVAALGAIKYEEKKEEIQNMDEVVLTIDPETVTALSWTNETTSLSFTKTDDVWSYDDDADFPVDAETVNEMLELWNGFGAAFVIDEVEDTAQYGLDEPVATIQVTTSEQIEGLEATEADGAYTYEIKLGTYSTMDSERYVSIGDGKVYLVDNDPLDLYAAELTDMIDNDDTPQYEDILSFTVEGEDNYSISYNEESTATYSEDDVFFAEIDGQSLPLDPVSVRGYASDLKELVLTNYVNYKATDEDLAEYGLDDPELTVSMTYNYENENGETVEDTFVLHIGRNREAVEADEAAEAEALAAGEEYAPETVPVVYARVGDSPIVYELTSDEYDKVMAVTYDDLRHRELIWADTEEITQIDVTLEGNDYTFTRSDTENEDGTYVWNYGETEITIDTLQTALTALAAADGDSYTDEAPGDTQEISLTVTLDNENVQTVTIALYRYDGENCLATVDGGSVALIGRSLVVDVVEAVNAIVLTKE